MSIKFQFHRIFLENVLLYFLNSLSSLSGRLTGFKGDFNEASHAEVPERSSDNTTGKYIMIGEGI